QSTLNKNFVDANQIPAWAKEYTHALINEGYVSGMSETTLAPLGNLTRAQMVKLMDNLSGLVK
ncbi:S-layer homology domain-containing protein, partial [Klebsiella pneumoniae]|uniref:S-layer homology domain-containing protein n=1 Tax=Klebsiella pneumoniae TaxID=573 RepID=UPI0025A28707